MLRPVSLSVPVRCSISSPSFRSLSHNVHLTLGVCISVMKGYWFPRHRLVWSLEQGDLLRPGLSLRRQLVVLRLVAA